MLLNFNELTLEVKAATNQTIIGSKRNLADVTICTRALLDDQPFYVDESRRAFFTPLESSKYKSSHSLTIPIKYLDKKLGVINFTDFETDDTLDKGKVQQLINLTKHLAVHLYAPLTKEQLESKIRQFEDANKRLIDMDELKTNLTNFIVHDLKGPITTVMANLDMLSYQPLTAEQLDCVTLAMDDIYKLQEMVLNILDVQKMEQGKSTIYRDETDIKTLIQRELDPFKNLLSLKNIELKLDGVSSHLCYIDEILIGRVMTNLFRNALEYSPAGGKISITTDYDDRKKELVVRISDQGKGIPDDLKGKIFDKFYQTKNNIKRIKTSTGLGLAFCKFAINAHGGNIWVEDSEAGGATFVFNILETLPERED